MSGIQAAAEMPKYKSHKTVHALKIANVQINLDQSAMVTPVDEGFAPFEAPQGWGTRFKGGGEDFGYYVVYDDGYASWSPTKAFEDGYTQVGALEGEKQAETP